MRHLRWWRYAAMLAGSGLLLQTSSCALDQTTINTLTTAVVQALVQALLGSLTTGVTT